MMRLYRWLKDYLTRESPPDYTALAYRNPNYWPVDEDDL